MNKKSLAPAAIASKLILKGDLNLIGCHIPTHEEIYPKLLAELKTLGIEFKEKTEAFMEKMTDLVIKRSPDRFETDSAVLA